MVQCSAGGAQIEIGGWGYGGVRGARGTLISTPSGAFGLAQTKTGSAAGLASMKRECGFDHFNAAWLLSYVGNIVGITTSSH